MKGFFLLWDMSHLTLQLEVLIALYVLFRWCHGGLTNINCSGNMWVEPGEIFQMGMNVSIYCQEALKNCRPTELYFYKNGIKERLHITRINRTTARICYKDFSESHVSVHCTAVCPGHFRETLICGKDISSGYPPDAPSKVTCVIYEDSGNMTCTWNTGNPTYIDTKYVVHVKSLETEEEQQYLASSCVNISIDSLQGGRKYLVWVQAVNALGTKDSPRLQVHLDDIVIPSASVISGAETINANDSKTIIYWNSKTMIEKVFCEMRYKTNTNHTWNVRGFDTNFTYVQRSEFYLEPNSKYVFQVRCRGMGKSSWQPWSLPFVHKTPPAGQGTILLIGNTLTSLQTHRIHLERLLRLGVKPIESLYQPAEWTTLGVRDPSAAPSLSQVPQVTTNSSHEAQNVEMLAATIFKGHLTSDNSQDTGLLSGMVFLASMLPIFSLIGIFNRSLRIGVFENNNASEQALYADPVLTEISEIFPREHKPKDYEEEKFTGLPETRDSLPLSSSSSVVYIPDLNTGYKPQISNVPPGENLFINRDERDSATPEPAGDHFAILKKYPNFAFSASSMNSLSNTLTFNELNLVLDQGEFNPLDLQNSRQEERTMLLESDSVSETIPEQTLLSDEFVSCLAIRREDLPSINSYFPQNILESHFSGISLLQK